MLTLSCSAQIDSSCILRVLRLFFDMEEGQTVQRNTKHTAGLLKTIRFLSLFPPPFRLVFQVKSNFRTAITVPEKCWTRFRDILNEYCEKMSELATTTADNNHAVTSSASASGGGSQK